jgi:hypothetical protein
MSLYDKFDVPDWGFLDWIDDNRGKAGAIAILILFAAFFASTNIPNSPLYSGGWEVNTDIYGVQQNGVLYTLDGNLPWKVEYWGTESVRYDTDASLPNELGASFEGQDYDYIGCADTQIDITAPAHITFDYLTQSWVPAKDDEVFYQYSKTVQYTDEDTGEEITEVYFWDHHVYSYWITTIADPDIFQNGAFSYCECKPASFTVAGKGAISSILVKSKFELNPWNIGPDTFQLENDDGSISTYSAMSETFWSGVMSASVMESYAGLVQKSRLEDADVSGFDDSLMPASGIHASATMSGSLNMYYVENPTQTVQEWDDEFAQDNYDAIQGVPTKVIIDAYGELEPGFSWPLGGTISTSAVMFQYKIRVDVLVSGGYYLASGQQPEDPVDPVVIDTGSDPIGALLAWGASLFQSATGFLTIIVIVVMVYFVYKISKWIFGGRD